MSKFDDMLRGALEGSTYDALPQDRKMALRGLCFNSYVQGVKDCNEAEKAGNMHELAMEILTEVGEMLKYKASEMEAAGATKQ